MSLAERLIRDNFQSATGILAIGGVPVTDLVQAYGTPLFVYDAAILERSYNSLCQALAGFAEVYYSIKANPNPGIVRRFVEWGAGLEVASGGEFRIARDAGCHPGRILFAGPGKGEKELELAIGGGIGEIHLESFEEISLCAEIANRVGCRLRVVIRFNPLAQVQGGAMRMGGKASVFGFDEEILGQVVAAISAHQSLDLCGIHMFAGTQILDATTLLAQWRHGISVAAAVAGKLGRPIQTIDLGGGLGIPYHANDPELDVNRLMEETPALAAAVHSEGLLRGARVLIEPGRFLTGPAGVYIAAVRSVKLSRGERFVVLDGGMHHHLAASGNLGQVIKRDFPIVAATRLESSDRRSATVTGPLCTPLDTLGRQTLLPELSPGDLIAILQSGAYALSASPAGFLSHPAPSEVLVAHGRHIAIGRSA